MKQKIVVNVQMRCGKCRTEAMKIAASANGVTSVVLQGSEKDVIVVVGNGVDSVGLCNALRKKVGRTILVSVERVKDDPPKSEEIKKEGKSQEKKTDDYQNDQDTKTTDKKKVTWLL